MVPIPSATSMEQLNELLTLRAAKFAHRTHWKKQISSAQLFIEDQQALMPLPSARFDPVQYEARKANKYGHVQVNQNTYAAGPQFAGRLLTVGLRHETIELLDEQARILRAFPRIFGVHPETISEPASVLGVLARKPGGWGNSPIRAQFADSVKDWIDTAEHSTRRQFFAALEEAATATGFATAVEAASQLVADGTSPIGPTLSMLARRIAQGTEFETGIVDLGVYDRLFNSSSPVAEQSGKGVDAA